MSPHMREPWGTMGTSGDQEAVAGPQLAVLSGASEMDRAEKAPEPLRPITPLLPGLQGSTRTPLLKPRKWSLVSRTGKITAVSGTHLQVHSPACPFRETGLCWESWSPTGRAPTHTDAAYPPLSLCWGTLFWSL